MNHTVRLVLLLSALTGVSVFLCTANAAEKSSAPSEKTILNSKYKNLELFQKVLQFAEKNYVEPVSDDKLIQGAIRGMMESLDPHSNFLAADIYKEMKEETEGKFGGVGLEVAMKDNVITVISPMEDSPSWKLGIRSGDRLVRIDGESTKGMNLSEAIQKMRGKPGTQVKVSFYRTGWKKFKDFTLKRQMISLKSVKAEELESGYGYVRLASFSESAAKEIDAALTKFEGKRKLQGLVFDLRNNPGGLLDQAVDVSSLFIDSGVIVSTIGRDPTQKEVRNAKPGKTRKELPVVVLVNSGSASASEIVAAALQDSKRAMILGETTFGKGSVQTVIPLGDDMGLKLTIAKYYSPSGRSIQETGVVPDIVLDEFDPKLLQQARINRDTRREKDLKGHLKNTGAAILNNEDFSMDELAVDNVESGNDGDEPPVNADPKKDYQVTQALRYLKSFEVFKKLK